MHSLRLIVVVNLVAMFDDIAICKTLSYASFFLVAYKKRTASPPGFDVTPFPLFCKYELSSHKAKNRPRISSKSCTNVLPGH